MARKRYRKFFGKGPLDYLPRLPKLDLDPDTKKGIFVVFVLAFGAISFLSLFNLAGALGEYIDQGVSFLFGWGRWVFPFLLLAWGFLMYREQGMRGYSYVGGTMFLLSLLALLHVIYPSNLWQANIDLGKGGGYIGFHLLNTLVKLAGFWGGLIILIALFLVSLMTMFNKTLTALFGPESFVGKLLFPIRWLVGRFRRNGEEEPEAPEEEEVEEEGSDDESAEESADEAEGEEADEEPEAKPVAVGFSEKKIAAAATLEKATAWKQSHIKIDLPIDLLSDRLAKPLGGNIEHNMEVIKHTLEHFGIPVEMGPYAVGPTVTQYTFKPADGIKLTKITTLNNDLALALAAHPIRIEAPIPNKSMVGVEVPNQTKAIVGLREVLGADDFKNRKTSLMVALGKDVAGKSWLYDLGRMPHLLVAGATNSGKSVCLNSVIVSLLYQNNPDDLKFIMVDPKRVELTVYNGIPHLLTPVITDVNKTINALKWCLNEMDRRFDVLSKHGKRNIDAYNASTKEKMPYIIFIIDELADLMVAAARDIEAGVIRLSQMARAVGIHLVLATQRPSVDIITGVIKANMPARIAFSVASSTDSRTILDTMGAEKLLGRGDMLFAAPDSSKPVRLQGAWVSDQEIKKIVHYIKDKGGEPQYDESITERQKVKGMGAFGVDSEVDDDLFEEAKELVINAGKASTSFLQRKLAIGYGRAAKLLDMLEEVGVVSAPNGAKPREILVSREQYEALISSGVSGMALHNRDETQAPEEYLDDGSEDEESSSAEDEDVEDEGDDESEEDDKGEEDESGDEADDDEDSGEEEEEEGTEDMPPEDEENEKVEEAVPARHDSTSGASVGERPATKKKMDLDEIYSGPEETEQKPKRVAKPGDDDFDRLFSR